MTLTCPLAPAEEWESRDADGRQTSSSRAICINCRHRREEVGKHGVRVLNCLMHQTLMPRGEHLTKRYRHWSARGEVLGPCWQEQGKNRGTADTTGAHQLANKAAKD